MSGVKKLAGQTLWYGVPTVISKFLSYGLSLLGFGLFNAVNTSDLTQIYAVIPFLNIVYTYGLETAYFRFVQTKDHKHLYNTLCTSILVSSILFTAVLFLFREPLTQFLDLQDKPEFVTWAIWITFFDTLAALPFAKLRQEGRPRKYAFVKLANILLNVAFTLLFLYGFPAIIKNNPEGGPLHLLYDPSIGVGYFVIANLIASAATLLFLLKEVRDIRFEWDSGLWKEVFAYSYPLVIVGLGGMVNEMLSRLVYRKILHLDPIQEKHDLGVFGANYKLAVLITIFIQMFRLAAEPFFFNQSKQEGAQRTYARVMKFFVIACCFMFLGVSLFLDAWKYLIAWRYSEYAEGIHIVPILAMGSVMLGIYYNLSVWYKLTDRNMTGAWITLGGAVITILLNIWWIPIFGYTGAAWATFCCYAFMMVVSYFLGQKYYPVPYATKKLLAYLSVCILLYLVHALIRSMDPPIAISILSAFFFFGLFVVLVLKVEASEMARLPFIGKYLKKDS